jgi:predicted nucleotidyltransferase
MLTHAQINIDAVRRVAVALGELNQNVVYVGGAVVYLYIDNPAAEDVRPTKDVDFVIQIASPGKLEDLRILLYQKGFQQSTEDNVICRFRFHDIKVDVMSTQPVGWAPANPWFEGGFHKKLKKNLGEVEVNLLPLSYFLATKFSAFADRGGSDPRTSHDFEDIVYILDNASSVKDEIVTSPQDVQAFLKEWFNKILTNRPLQEAIIGNLLFDPQMERYNSIIHMLRDTAAEL